MPAAIQIPGSQAPVDLERSETKMGLITHHPAFTIFIILIIFCASVVLVGSIIMLASYPPIEETASLAEIPACPDCPACELHPTPCPACERPRFQEIAENLASEENYRGEYNCDEFSKELIRRLEDAGYSAKYCFGTALWCNPEESEYNCKHVWVKIEDVYIEAVDGEILLPEQLEEEYKLEWCN